MNLTGDPGQLATEVLAKEDPPAPEQTTPGKSVDIVQPRGSADFPNPAERRNITIDEPLITYQGKIIPQVILVNTFLGSAPENRKAWHQALGIPAINVLSYRGGTRTDYLKDSAGIGSYFVPFTLTTAEYIGLQDPVVLTTNEGGEFVPLPEQLDLLVGKAINLARLSLRANADKRVALLFWNHPLVRKPGASNLNVPRSLEYLVEHLRSEGYAFEAVTEQQMIDTVGQMLRPAYRAGGIPELMRTRIGISSRLPAIARGMQPCRNRCEMTSKLAGEIRKKACGLRTRIA